MGETGTDWASLFGSVLAGYMGGRGTSGSTPNFYNVPQTPEDKAWNDERWRVYNQGGSDQMRAGALGAQQHFAQMPQTANVRFASPMMQGQQFAGGIMQPRIDFSSLNFGQRPSGAGGAAGPTSDPASGGGVRPPVDPSPGRNQDMPQGPRGGGGGPMGGGPFGGGSGMGAPQHGGSPFGNFPQGRPTQQSIDPNVNKAIEGAIGQWDPNGREPWETWLARGLAIAAGALGLPVGTSIVGKGIDALQSLYAMIYRRVTGRDPFSDPNRPAGDGTSTRNERSDVDQDAAAGNGGGGGLGPPGYGTPMTGGGLNPNLPGGAANPWGSTGGQPNRPWYNPPGGGIGAGRR